MENKNASQSGAIVFILLTLFIDILGIGIIIPVLPELVKEFVGGDSPLAGVYVGVLSGSYALVQFLSAPVVGALSDRFGRRPVILASLFGLGVDFVFQGFAPSISWLFVGRILAGVMGASVTTARAYIADVSTPETRARNFGLVGVMFGLAFIVGPALGGLLGGIYLRLPFFVSAALALANFIYGYLILPESLPPEERGEFSLANANPIGSLRILAAYPIVGGVSIAFLFMSLAQRGLENVWVLYTAERFDWGELTNGLVLGLVGVMAVIVQGLLVRPIISRIGEQRAVLLGLGVSAIAFLAYGTAPTGWSILVIITVGSIGGIAGPAIQSIVAGAAPSSEQGKIQGAMTSLMSLTSIIAPLLFTAGLFSYFSSDMAFYYLPGAPFIVGSGMLVIAFAIAWFVFRNQSQSQQTATIKKQTDS